ncbi:disease resistance-like protein DSC1 isoform X2 [Pistacia vera]|uniref:disease resistance-like protein DSC1 isoform X2 n=1 Tax=Pistacia vera TaxID=55513 RepID=UPI00126355A5|nr:disease resistance-like protein DSC1 isoform X2 [Pistacia vera]
MAASSSSATPQLKNYDVFLSFRGEDTRNNFTSHLHVALCRKGIAAFIDKDLIRGDKISSALLNTIKASKISIIIFSQNYGSSRWCLQELEQILNCMESEEKQIVIPIFYHVDPSHVRNQTGSFEKGFAELQDRFKEEPEMLKRWKDALNKAADLSGWTINAETYEADLTEEISGDILKRLNKLSPTDYKGLVGVKILKEEIKSLLNKGSNGVSVIGILGIGGIGKTTITRVVFDEICRNFEGSYFAENVREEWEKNSSLTHLKQKLVSTILDNKDPNLDIGLNFTMVQKKKVLIVFDDVTSSLQIEALIGNLNQLSPGSRIIITTRDKQVLRSCGVAGADIYEVGGLHEKEAHQLFNKYAFKLDSPTEDFIELSNKVVAYSKGVPLALKVLGSYLFSKGEFFWESAISNLEKGPLTDIQNVLKISYDGLDDVEKVLFLDIACFFKGEYEDLVKETLNGCRIEVLIDKCLVSKTEYNKITMHDLLQEMGKKIAQYHKDIRLWHHEDILKVFKKYKGTEAIRCIKLDISKISNPRLYCNVLSRMDNLTFFKVYNSECQDNYENKLDGFEEVESFPNDITFFGWNDYPYESLPLSFPSESLVTLDMRYSKVKHWNGVQNLINLKYVNLSFSRHMIEIPNLSKSSNLKKLILRGCSSLLEIIPSSIQNLNKLVELDLSYCSRFISLPDGIQSNSINLSFCHDLKIAPKISCKVKILKLMSTAIKELPFIEHPSGLVELDLKGCSLLENLSSSICKLKFLKVLNLYSCSKLERLPDDFGDLKALEYLSCEMTVLKEVPSSILHLPNLECLDLSRYVDEPAPLNWVLNCSSGSSSLISLYLDNCQMTKLPGNLGQLSFLKELYLSGNNFERLPENIKRLSNLCFLDISHCSRLQVLPKLPMGVNVVASDCSSLESISDPSFLLLPYWRSRITTFVNCFKLDLPKIIYEGYYGEFCANICFPGNEFPKILHEGSCREFCATICFPGNEIPKWFTFQNTGSSISLDQSPDWHDKNFIGFLTYVVFDRQVKVDIFEDYCVTYSCLVKSEDGKEQLYRNDSALDYIMDYDLSAEELDSFCPGDISSDHVLFCSVMKETFEVCDSEDDQIDSEDDQISNRKVLIKFDAFRMEIKKCGIHLLYVENYGEPSKTSGTSVDSAKKKGKEKDEQQSTVIDTTEPDSKKLKICNYENIHLNFLLDQQ